MKKAIYNKIGGGTLEIEYDENAPCMSCGFPVKEASMGGTDICPWCDTGNPMQRPEIQEAKRKALAASVS